MDDDLAEPSAKIIPIPLVDTQIDDDGDGEASDDEDAAPDWTKLMPVTIPKRGEKQFEPVAGVQGESNLQLRVLERARNAMFTTLRATRTTSNKSLSHAIWHSDIARAEVTVQRGVHFHAMGHSVPRSYVSEDGTVSSKKRIELLPEETLYLIERGSLFCWKEIPQDFKDLDAIENAFGSPMTLQQAYGEMISADGLTLERYQSFSYLRRLGYVVTRTNPPNPDYPKAPLYPSLLQQSPPIFKRLNSLFPAWLFSRVFNWWKPIEFRWLQPDKSYSHIFRSLRFIPTGYKTALHVPLVSRETPYKIFWNLYKPPTPFKKSSPPCPDFQVVVINARTTPMPSLRELSDLFDVFPEIPPPKPRQRFNPQDKTPRPALLPSPVTSPSLVRRLLAWLWPGRFALEVPYKRRPNPFMMMKAGRKMVVIAVVDAGNVGFFRFSQGVFTEWPMI